VVSVIDVAPVAEAARLPSGREDAAEEALRPQIDELLVCSLQGEILHEWKCTNPNSRLGFLEFLSQKARQLAQGLPLGEFDRVEVNGPQVRIIAQLEADRALFVRTSLVPAGGEAPSLRA
jgi:hypothetical protein